MFWNIMTALQDTKEWGPIPKDGWMDKDEEFWSPVNPGDDPDAIINPFARKAKKAKVLHEVSHKDDDVIDTPEIQGDEE